MISRHLSREKVGRGMIGNGGGVMGTSPTISRVKPERKADSSHIWRDILRSKDIIRNGLGWQVGDGKEISFWFDIWVNDKPLHEELDSPLAASARQVKVADFLLSNRDWDISKLETLLPEEVVEEVRAVPIPTGSDYPDEMYWRSSSTGEFSVKSAYDSLALSQVNEDWSWLWKIRTSEKVRCFLWLVMKNKLLTNAERGKRHITEDTSCNLCNNEEETVLHILRDCPFAMAVWRKSGLGLPRIGDMSPTSLEWVHSHCKAAGDTSGRTPHASRFAYTAWLVWKSRNSWIFEGKKPDVDRIVRKAHLLAEEYTNITILNSIKQQKEAKIVKWIPPESGFFKLNCDGSSRGRRKGAGAGGLIRNHKGEWVSGFILNIGKTECFKSELWALRQGLLLACDLDINKVIVEVDSESMLKVVKKKNSLTNRIGVLVRDCQKLLADERFIKFQHTFREGNNCADSLANAAHESAKGLLILHEPPVWIKSLLQEDANGFERIRY
ncbi:unnamed protein product [Cuscuta epithymum]|uniref:RNase H type-1 domain-containing protein n=1 Tax=Cuscuta epithymum TaxID=186058 RepID=A0AAV0C010_9ASTE|nr:unnamed protein product [Cuscuta epithymum]